MRPLTGQKNGMTYNSPDTLVSTGWLSERLSDPDVRIIDGSWHLPDSGRDGFAEFQLEHIPGAWFFDINLIADTECGLPHMAPSLDLFESKIGEMGIDSGMQVVVYDGAGLFSAARVWWLFRYMGHFAVAVLDGGLPKWRQEGREVSSSLPEGSPRQMKARLQSGLVCDARRVLAATSAGDAQVIDARPANRFKGEAPEPRPGLKRGHIPGSINIPFPNFLNSDGTFKSSQDLATVFEMAGIDLNRPIISSCGSGVTASIIDLALKVCGHRDHAVYDGSWAEWGNGAWPVETG